MGRRRRAIVALTGLAAALAVVTGRRHARVHSGHRLIPCPASYAAGTVLFSGFYDLVARDAASLAPLGSILEVGAGPGRLMDRIARRAPLAKIVATDVDPRMVALARARLERFDGDHARLRAEEADVQSLPYPDRSFDLVVSTLSMHHWPDAVAGLAEIHRVLRPGGTAVVYDLAGPIARLERVASTPARSAEASPFGGGSVTTVRWPGPISFIVRLELRRPVEAAAEPRAALAVVRPAAEITGAAPAVELPAVPEGRVRAFVGLGANLGDAPRSLAAAIHALAALPDTSLVGVSRLYETRPVGVTDQPDFHNAVAAVDVPPGPDPETGALALLTALKGIERAFGRQERERWGPRELDLDLLLFGDAAIAVERPPAARSADPARASRLLEVPHREAADRLFVLAPLADLAPDLRPPGWDASVAERLARVAAHPAAGGGGPEAARPVARWDAPAGDWATFG